MKRTGKTSPSRAYRALATVLSAALVMGTVPTVAQAYDEYADADLQQEDSPNTTAVENDSSPANDGTTTVAEDVDSPEEGKSAQVTVPDSDEVTNVPDSDEAAAVSDLDEAVQAVEPDSGEAASVDPTSAPAATQEASPEDEAISADAEGLIEEVRADAGDSSETDLEPSDDTDSSPIDDNEEGKETLDSEATSTDASTARLSAANEDSGTLTFASGSVSIDGVSAGSASYNSQAATLTLNSITASSIHSKRTIKIILKGKSSCTKISLDGNSSLTVAGTGSLSLAAYISASNFKLEGGTIRIADKTFGIWASNSFSMSGGSLVITGGGSGGTAIHSDGDVKITGGKISLTGLSDLGIDAGRATETEAVERPGNVTITGGTVSIEGSSHCEWGIRANAGNIKITGGTVKVAAHSRALNALRGTYKGSHRGGTVSISGGSLTATVSNPSDNYAIYAGKEVSNKAAYLKTIKGRISVGAHFKVSGNTYRIIAEDDDSRNVSLTSYGSSKTKATFNTVKYGGRTYDITVVGGEAFNTSRGKKLKKITFKQSLTKIGKKAFYKTSSLTKLDLRLDLIEVWSSGKVTGLEPNIESCSVAKSAFKKCGKAGGKSLTVRVYGAPDGKSAYRKYLKKRGLSSKTKVVSKYY